MPPSPPPRARAPLLLPGDCCPGPRTPGPRAAAAPHCGGRDDGDDDNSNSNTDDRRDACVICLQPVHERAVAVPCNHLAFDFVCLASWLQDHATCPLCKTPLDAVEYDWRAPDDFKTFRVPRAANTLSTPLPSSALPAPSWPHRSPRRRTQRPRPEIYHAPLTPAAIARRRFVYRHALFSLHVGSNPRSRFRDWTAPQFAKSPVLQSKARTWIRRELQVFGFLRHSGSRARASPAPRASNMEFVLDYTVSILGAVDIKSSTSAAQRLLGDLLGDDNALLFLHELNHWLRSPYTQLENWDRHVRYTTPLPYSADELVDPATVPWGGFRDRAPGAVS